MKTISINIISVVFILFFCVNVNAQNLRVIDNKGTIKSINKVSYGTLLPSTTSTPLVPNNKHTKGDIYIIGNASSPERTYIFDGTNWVNITNGDLVLGHFIIDISDNGRTKEIKGLPFNPSKITFVAHANVGDEEINDDNDTGNNNTRGVQNSFGTMNGYAVKNSSGITQQVIYVGGHGNSINDISRFASSSKCVGLRFSSQNGDNLGVIKASLISFGVSNPDKGFTLRVDYVNGTVNPVTQIQSRKLLVMYTAYK